MHVYIRRAASCFEVGFYSPNKIWVGESTHCTADHAAARVCYLNGGAHPDKARADLALLDLVPAFCKLAGIEPPAPRE